MKILSLTLDTLYLRFLLWENGEVKLNQSICLDGREPELIASLLKKALKDDFDIVITSIESKKCFYKRIAFPFSHRSKIEKALPFQLESLPIDRQKSLYSLHFDGAFVDLFATHSDEIDHHLNALHRLQLNPDWVGSEIRALHKFAISKACDVVLHIGDEAMTLLYGTVDQVVKTFFIPIGAAHLASVIESEKLENIDDAKCEELIASIDRYIGFLEEEYSLYQPTFLLSGYAPHLLNFERFSHGVSETAALELGRILDLESKDPVQFRVKERTPKTHRAQIEKKALTFTFVSLFAIGVALFSSLYVQNKRLDELTTGLKQVLSQADLHRYNERVNGNSVDAFRSSLNAIEDELSERERFIDPIITPARVHAQIAALKKMTQASAQSFHYTLTSFATLEEPDKSFIAQIKIGFTDEKEAKNLVEMMMKKKSIYREPTVVGGEGEFFAQAQLF